ncbi:MAG: SDR family NAD(P)-dependent oxidoreductase [Opitutaceae bacterium]|nr:SDR family NAD(P)-dependent oxidoreductase [Opitutaceae bacterium]
MPSLSEALQPFAAVIVTGGSSGIGKSFIRLTGTLMARAVICNLSRRIPPQKICPNAEVRLNHFSCDLAQAAEIARAADAVCARIEALAPPGPVLLINNSGIGAFGSFADSDTARQLEVIDVNVRALVDLTGRLLPLLRVRGGAILNVASTVAFQPTPFAATYGASKAFVLHWTLALNHELRGTGVRALAVCPGTTTSEFFNAAGLAPSAAKKPMTMTADAVAEAALRALAAGRSQVVPGWFNKLYTFAGAKLPKPLAARVAARALRRYRNDGAGA